MLSKRFLKCMHAFTSNIEIEVKHVFIVKCGCFSFSSFRRHAISCDVCVCFFSISLYTGQAVRVCICFVKISMVYAACRSQVRQKLEVKRATNTIVVAVIASSAAMTFSSLSLLTAHFSLLTVSIYFYWWHLQNSWRIFLQTLERKKEIENRKMSERNVFIEFGCLSLAQYEKWSTY